MTAGRQEYDTPGLGVAMTETVPLADREREAAREHYNRVARLYDLVEVLDERTFRPWRQRLFAPAGLRIVSLEHLGKDHDVKMIVAGPARERPSGGVGDPCRLPLCICPRLCLIRYN